jgi:PITH domain
VVLHTAESQKGPKSISLLVNRPAIDFNDVGDDGGTEVAQKLEVPEDVVREGRPIELRFVRFQSVTSLHVSETFRLRRRTSQFTILLPRSLSAPITVTKRQLE